MKIISAEKFNTNNGWGFGGGIGTETVYDNDLVNRKGTAHFRHIKSESFDRWFIIVEKGFNLSLPKKPKSGDTIMVFCNVADHHQVVVANTADITKKQQEECKATGYKLIKEVVLPI